MSPTVIVLILTDDDAERETLLKVTQEEMVDHYVETCVVLGKPLWPFGQPGIPEVRRKALRSFLRSTRGTGSKF